MFTDLPNVDRILQVTVFSNTELLIKGLLLHITDVLLNAMSALRVQFNSIYFVFDRSKGVVNPQDIEHVNI